MRYAMHSIIASCRIKLRILQHQNFRINLQLFLESKPTTGASALDPTQGQLRPTQKRRSGAWSTNPKGPQVAVMSELFIGCIVVLLCQRSR